MDKEYSNDEIIFLGICDRVSCNRQNGQWNVLGLGNVLFSYIFPTRIDNLFIGLNLTDKFLNKEIKIQITNADDEEIGFVNLKFSTEIKPPIEKILGEEGVNYLPINDTGRFNYFISLKGMDAGLDRPGKYKLNLIQNETSKFLGSFQIIPVKAEALTESRIAAIKSNPKAHKIVVAKFGCKICSSELAVYAGLQKYTEQEEKGWLWYKDVPDIFSCECNRTPVSMNYIKENLHALLDVPSDTGTNISFLERYEKGTLQKIAQEFASLIEGKPTEEHLQVFIKDNPILFHQFSAKKIIAKPPIMSRFKGDFAILTAQKDLIFVEIEKSTTRLMKKGGHRSSELVHAFDQVRDWLNTIKQHRSAVLDDLGINKDDVNNIVGLVIAGREEGYDAKDMSKLKSFGENGIMFHTYDDLLFSLEALIKRFNEIK